MRAVRPITTTPADRLDAKERITALTAAGHGPLLDAIADPSSYAANGRLVFVRLGKLLGVTAATAAKRVKHLRDAAR